MPSIRLEDLTPFGRLALQLDREFAELARVGGLIEKVDLGTDAGLDEGVKILTRVAAHGQNIAATMQDFGKALQEARDKAEAATKRVAERAELIKKRRQEQDALQEKLGVLKEGLKTLGAGFSGAAKPAGELTDEDRRRIAADLEALQAPMTKFVEAAQAIKAECARANFKRLERQADAVIDSLQASRKKIAQALAPK